MDTWEISLRKRQCNLLKEENTGEGRDIGWMTLYETMSGERELIKIQDDGRRRKGA